MEAGRITNSCKMWWGEERCWCLRVEVLLREGNCKMAETSICLNICEKNPVQMGQLTMQGRKRHFIPNDSLEHCSYVSGR